MLWILVGAGVALLAIGLLALTCLRLWRTTKALGRAMSQASDSVGEALARMPSVEHRSGDT